LIDSQFKKLSRIREKVTLYRFEKAFPEIPPVLPFQREESFGGIWWKIPLLQPLAKLEEEIS
jgi:hypothetical protein